MKATYLQIRLCLDRLSGVVRCQKRIQFSGLPKRAASLLRDRSPCRLKIKQLIKTFSMCTAHGWRLRETDRDLEFAFSYS